MRRLLALFVLALFAAPAAADPILFYGADPGAGPSAPRPVSDATAAAFDAAVGPTPVITFETAPLGQVPPGGLIVAPGVTLTAFKNDGGIRAGGGAGLGYNTTPGGSRYAQVNNENVDVPGPTGLRFTFDAPIDSFGAYFTGVGSSQGFVQVVFDDGAAQVVPLPGAPNGGVLFFGFTDPGRSISQVTVQTAGANGVLADDVFSIDDVRFRAALAQSPVPEPATLATLGLMGAASLGYVRRRVRGTAAGA